MWHYSHCENLLLPNICGRLEAVLGGEVGKHKVRNFRGNIKLSNCLSFKKVEIGHVLCALSAEILYPAHYELVYGGESSVNKSSQDMEKSCNLWHKITASSFANSACSLQNPSYPTSDMVVINWGAQAPQKWPGLCSLIPVSTLFSLPAPRFRQYEFTSHKRWPGMSIDCDIWFK